MTVNLFDMAIRGAAAIEQEILRLISAGPARDPEAYKYWTTRLKELCLQKEMVLNNVVCVRGKQIIAERLGGTNTYTLNVSHGAVGTSTTSPVTSDTQLGAEIVSGRAAPASQDVSGASSGIVIISFFWGKSAFTNANVNEFASFIDGSLTINSGRIFSHVAFSSTINKTALKTLTVDATYTIS